METRRPRLYETMNMETRSPSSAAPPQLDHLGKHRQYWRDIILGVNDGLVSTFLLVAGVAGGGLSSIRVDILYTADGYFGGNRRCRRHVCG